MSLSTKSATPPEAGPEGPFKGIKVLDISTVLAAPIAATLLADFGAEVIKVEIPNSGDSLRQLPPHKNGIPLWTKVTNRNKKGITLDLRKDKGRILLERLITGQDVLVENFRPGRLDGWGLSKERLWEINPQLIILRVTGFGQTGPYRDRPGFARIFEALSGFVHLCGEPDGPPMYPGFPISDALTGVFGAYAIAAAIHQRDNSADGKGQEIDLSATEAMFRVLDFLPIEYDQLGVVRNRAGNRNSYSAPSDVYRTGDERWLSLAVSAPTVFARLAHALDRPDLLTDPRYSTNVARLENRAGIESILENWFLAHTEEEASQILRKHDVSFSPIKSIRDIFADPHFAEREAIISVVDKDFGSVKMQNVVPRFSNTPGRVWCAGPGIGENNAEILGEKLGLSEEELSQLRDENVI